MIKEYTSFHNLRISDHITLKLPDPCVNSSEIQREYSIKFLGVLLDENLTLKSHIKTIETKISKDFGILYSIVKKYGVVTSDAALRKFRGLVARYPLLGEENLVRGK